jgi:hypothetical protein
MAQMLGKGLHQLSFDASGKRRISSRSQVGAAGRGSRGIAAQTLLSASLHRRPWGASGTL